MNDFKDTPTIAELWGKLKAALDMIEMDDPNAHDTTMGGKWGTPPGEYGKMAAKMVPALRQQLSGIAKTVPDSGGQSSIFTIDGGTLLIENTVDRLRHDNAETLSEFIAACGYWLWELQQRGREAIRE